MAYTLELLHIADQEAGVAAIEDAPRLSAVANALRAQDLGEDGEPDNTLFLSSGDAIIPGLFFSASEAVHSTAGIADIEIQNQLGVQAIAFGNHEFDLGPAFMADLISGDAEGTILGEDFGGAEMPYLGANLDFSGSSAFASLVVEGGGAPEGNTVTSSVAIDVNGTPIGVVGATTPNLGAISSPGDVVALPSPFDATPTAEQLDALAEIIQAEVDALLAANPGMDKVVLLSHMQRLSIEEALAGRLEGVDIIVGGGSNTRLFDDDDRVRDGDSVQGEYPTFLTGGDDNPVALVNTDGSYKYLGRLVIEFDDDGVILPESYDPAVSGAYATDAEGVAALGAEGLIDPEIQRIADEIEAQILATESNVFGVSDVFLNGNRSGLPLDPDDPDGVRTQETNLGNLTADANLAISNEIVDAEGLGDDVVVSIKNGGGIRASIGQATVPPGGSEAVRAPNPGIPGVKPEGGISQNDIETTLAFNNGLTLLTLTRAELLAVLEHGVGALPDVAGSFAQVSGVRYSFDPDRPAGERIENAVIVDEAGNEIDRLVDDGALAGNPEATVRIVTLGFLAEPRFDDDGNFVGGGDGYPFPNTNTDPARGEVGDPDVIARVNPVSLAGADDAPRAGEATFAPDGSEQDALAEYLADAHGRAVDAFDEADLGREADGRIVNLDFRADPLDLPPEASGALGFSTFGTFVDEGVEGASEVVAHEDGFLFVTDGENDAIDVFENAPAGERVRSIDLAALDGYGGIQSLDVANGLLAAAIERDPVEEGGELVSQPGFVALFDAATGDLLSTVDVGNLPDAVAFSPDGTRLAVAGEGEFNEDSDQADDPLGTVALVDVTDPEAPTADIVDFTGVSVPDGVRVFPGNDFAEDAEPEYVTFSADGSTVFASLQENNAIAAIDVASGTVSDILPLGDVDFGTGPALDPLDDGEITIRNIDGVKGLRMPDAIATYETGGTNYIVTANEGDSRGFDEARVADLVADGRLDPAFEQELRDRGLVDSDPDTEIGVERLEVSTIDGDTDGDGLIEELVTFNSRSFSIFDEDGDLVFDSGDDFERIIAEVAPERFNNDDGEPIAEEDDNRSDAKGPEPEAVAVGEIDGRTYAFIGLERDSGIMIYDVTDPADSAFVNYIPPRFVGSTPDDEVAAHGPEIIAFIPADESGSGSPQIAVSYEISGTTITYDLAAGFEETGTPGDDTILGGLGPDTLIGLRGDDELAGGGGDDELVGNRGDDFLPGGPGDDSIEGRLGNDTLGGGGDDDTLVGAGGDDALDGSAGDDILSGNAGADVLLGGSGKDGISGGPGADSIDGGRGDDVLLGRLGDDAIVGGAGNDSIAGLRGDDSILGGDGDDFAIGHSGDDVIGGEDGDDRLVGRRGDDEIDGGAGEDDILGNAGNDTVEGRANDDLVRGNAGADLLSGQGGDDTIAGNPGDDTIDGGAGDDVLVGGRGADTFLFSGGFGADRVLGFDPDEDLIEVAEDGDALIATEAAENGTLVTVSAGATEGSILLVGVSDFDPDQILLV